MNRSLVLLFPLLVASIGTALAGDCPATAPTSRGNGQVAGVSGAGGLVYYFSDAKLDGFDCFRLFSEWFPSYMPDGNSHAPDHQVVDMAYAHDATASFYNVVASSAGAYTLSFRYAFDQGLFPGVMNRGEELRVNGSVLTKALDFPITDGFDTFKTSNIVVDLKAGRNTIELVNLDGASISRADSLTVSPVADHACSAPPSAPKSVSARAESDTRVGLSWSASASKAPCAVRSYDVFRTSDPKVAPSADDEIAIGVAGTRFDDRTALCNLTYYYSIAAIDVAGPSVASQPVAVTTDRCPATKIVRIRSGGPAVSAFAGDTDYSGGHVLATGDPIATVTVPAGLPMELFEASREGSFRYTVKGFEPHSTHALSLYFIEPTYDGVGLRLFDVTINGKKVLKDFDVFLAAGDNYTPLVEAFSEDAGADGEYLIDFTPVRAGAVVSGLEID